MALPHRNACVHAKLAILHCFRPLESCAQSHDCFRCHLPAGAGYYLGHDDGYVVNSPSSIASHSSRTSYFQGDR